MVFADMGNFCNGIDFLSSPDIVAQQLIGSFFLYRGVGGIIVETEAYDQTDPASHSFCGPTGRNAVMFGPPGSIYVYRSYGIHWCFNFVCREENHGSAVLIRAMEPVEGIDVMRQRRKLSDIRLLCAGPGRVCQALGISQEENGLSLNSAMCCLKPRPKPVDIIAGPRIGISRATETHWRFGLAHSPFLSRPFPKPSPVSRSD